MSGKLLLLPNVLQEELPIAPFFPISVTDAVRSIAGLIAESEKAARRYLRKFISHEEMQKIPICLLNEHTQQLKSFLEPMKKGEVWGLISDAGLPCLADPGSDLVWLAHQAGIDVAAFVGPSSIILGLQLSGFSGQHFTFHGYLPKEPEVLEKKLKEMEKQPGTHIWIEAPYRSQKMLEQLLKTLQSSTRLCVAVNLTTPAERLLSASVSRWRSIAWHIEKEPAIFLLTSSSPL